MQLHLFSAPGAEWIEYILEACQPLLAAQSKPVVTYLPAASVQRRWVRETQAAFRGLAKVIHINTETHSPARLQEALDQANVLYIPGGNTYLLAHRLGAVTFASQVGGDERLSLTDEIRRRVQAGLPLVAFSAGAVLCGPDILTTNDINACGCARFEGLNLLPFNLNMHYPSDEAGRQGRDDRLQEYLTFHKARTILALEDGAYLQVKGEIVTLVNGPAWKIEPGKASVRIEVGEVEHGWIYS
jgi:dipeptidase E